MQKTGTLLCHLTVSPPLHWAKLTFGDAGMIFKHPLVLIVLTSCLLLTYQHSLAMPTSGKSVRASSQTKPKRTRNTVIRLNTLNTINVGNDISVRVSIGGRANQLRTAHLNDLTIRSDTPDTLSLSGSPGTSARIVLKTLPKYIHLSGTGRLILHNAQKTLSPLHIKATARGKLYLTGWLNIVSIDNLADAEITAYWLRSQQTEIHTKAGNIHLSGECHHLLAELSGHAKLDAASLNSQHVWAYTADHALAKLRPLRSLNATAVDYSQIAYFKQLSETQIQRTVHDQANVLFLNRALHFKHKPALPKTIQHAVLSGH